MVVSRRVVVGSGLAVVAAGAGLHLAGRDDDLLRAAGARPRPVPDAADTALLRTAAAEQVSLVEAVEGLDEDGSADLAAVLRRQLDALGGPPSSAAPTTAAATGGADAVARSVAAAARRRESDALTAVSPDLARVLASLAAGQAQVARTLGQQG